MVLFVTGVCDQLCYYCPLSERRRGQDVVFADEVPVQGNLDVILECRAIDAEGTGITGGDPLMRLSRTLKYIRLLKDIFGGGHHIHLYTNGRHATEGALRSLKEAGLDEIRFHPTKEFWGRVALAKSVGMSTGGEVPAIPGDGRLIKEFILYLDREGADFININQLEFCTQNAMALKQRGFSIEEGSMAAVSGSEETAIAVIRWASEMGLDLPVHYCSSSVKDAIQLKNRLTRRGRNAARPYEEITEGGLLGKLIVRPATGDLKSVRCRLMQALGIGPHMIGLSANGIFLELPCGFLERIRRILPRAEIRYVQTYPTFSRDELAGSPC